MNQLEKTIDEAYKIYTKLRAFDAVEKARKQLPDYNVWNDPEFDVQLKIPIDSDPLNPLVVRITFRKEKYIKRWRYKCSKKINFSNNAEYKP